MAKSLKPGDERKSDLKIIVTKNPSGGSHHRAHPSYPAPSPSQSHATRPSPAIPFLPTFLFAIEIVSQ
jgi:hypothetical protein